MSKWRGLARASGAQIGRIAKVTFVCHGCGRQYSLTKPAQCDCGRMDFARIDSAGEARWWAQLQTLERAGKITNLRRQVSYDLKTRNLANGLEVVVARYVADFVFEEDGVLIIADHKGAITDVATLKLRFMAAMGLPVRILT